MPSEPIAIIGSACRFAGGASSPSKLWDLLLNPRDVSKEVPTDRFSLARYYHPDGKHHGTMNIKRSYFLDEDIKRFDAGFFGIPPPEAESIDPQSRMLLETIYEAMERGGIPMERLNGSDTAVYVGQMCHDYYTIGDRDLNSFPTYHITGSATSNTANRVSYLFDWHGPSVTLDTACSSSLVAVHDAVLQLRSGRSRVAVAAGTNLIYDPAAFISMTNLNMLSTSGKCQMWDADADGYARGEGVAAIILKPLSKALEDGDHIESIIRETGVNQDGHTAGITMPSGGAQADLICKIWKQAGLDPKSPLDRCQYFEAHGTGTQAGDPQEAKGVSLAFFDHEARPDGEKMWIGSVKTIMGHTEGTAGIAGLLKTSLALQHGVIPPNLWFNKLNPHIDDFYHNLQIATSAQQWPIPPPGQPRRASVNSFGFGGTNAHAILESFNDAPKPNEHVSGLVPFVFSAATEKSLIEMAITYLDFLRENTIDPANLAYTLSCHRSALPVKVAFPASDISTLCMNIKDKLLKVEGDSNYNLGIRSTSQSPSIVGIFTGQGAQWARMGVKLICNHLTARRILQMLDETLQALPSEDRPQWFLLEELEKIGDESRLHEAGVSQPLCTAVQIILVDLLRAAGVTFKAVVGHSSGEIAAAYAAGFLDAKDCMRIAYYRGVHAHDARGPKGQEGAMMAVGKSFEEAKAQCQTKQFSGKVSVAASNASASTTLSGDREAIERLKKYYDEKGTFARLLKVDTAYHSHHMLRCADGYRRSLKHCGIQVRQPSSDSPMWLSSVYDGRLIQAADDLKGEYWVENMVRPVLFSQAINTASQEVGPFQFALEVGPHPALKGPATQMIKEVTNHEIPYSGTLSRGVDDCEAFSQALGALWTNLGAPGIALRKFAAAFGRGQLLTDLPSYPWDHNQTFWSESRTSALTRTNDHFFHDLLGNITAQSTEDDWSWHNILKTRELPWLRGHVAEEQVIFPTTAYLAQAVEAAMQIAGGRSVQSIELSDFTLARAIIVDENHGAETLVRMSNIQDGANGCIRARYTCHSANRGAGQLSLAASGQVEVLLGEQLSEEPSRLPPIPDDMADVDIDRFEDELARLGYGYDGIFKRITTLRRKLDQSVGTVATPPLETPHDPWIFHPAMLDNAIRQLFAAYSFPGDDRLWNLFLPTKLGQVTVSPSRCGSSTPEEIHVYTQIISSRPKCIVGDVSLYSPEGHRLIDIQGLEVSPIREATADDDRCLFMETVLGTENLDAGLALPARVVPYQQNQKAQDRERAALYFLRSSVPFMNQDTRREDNIPLEHDHLSESHPLIKDIQAGRHPYVNAEWLSDTRETIDELIGRYREDDDFATIQAAGSRLRADICGNSNARESLTFKIVSDDGLHTGLSNSIPAGILKQITHRHPSVHILEVGAGIGDTTKAVLAAIEGAFESYTFTDFSNDLFSEAKENLKEQLSQIDMRVLDIGMDPAAQNFDLGSYDLIIARDLNNPKRSVRNALLMSRRLLKPGGYLVFTESTGYASLCTSLFKEPPSGKPDSHLPTSSISQERWNYLLLDTGFSGIETHSPLLDPIISNSTTMVSQATDRNVISLRSPLKDPLNSIPDLIILVSTSEREKDIEDQIKSHLFSHCDRIMILNSLEEALATELPSSSTILNLLDLGAPIFERLTESALSGFKRILNTARNIMWVTEGYQREQPYAAVSVGLARSLLYDKPEVRIQMIDIDQSNNASDIIATKLLQLYLSDPEGGNAVGRDMVWTHEPELMVRNNRVYVPRLKPRKDQNNRINSDRRDIWLPVTAQDVTLRLEWPQESCRLFQDVLSQTEPAIRIEHSTLSALPTPAGYLFINLGTNLKTGKKSLVLSERLASSLPISPGFWIPVSDTTIDKAPQYLSLVAAYLAVERIVIMFPPNARILALGPDQLLASWIQDRVKERGGHAFIFTTANSGNHSTVINPLWPKHTLRKVISRGISVFLDFSDPADGISAKVASCLPEYCQRLSKSVVFSHDASIFSSIDAEATVKNLRAADAAASEVLRQPTHDLPVAIVSLEETASLDHCSYPVKVLEWSHKEPVLAAVQTADRMVQFSSDRTYWLVGLTGDMGWSICDWMIAHGARHIVLTSRNPNLPKNWLDQHRKQGIQLGCIAGDITVFDDLAQVYHEITETYPEIGGVVNGTMILQDQRFDDHTLESWQATLSPKVIGTLNLDRLFSDQPLELFIVFSSITSTLGNMGQTAYGAANMFMKSVVAQRRERGLSGSSIDIAQVFGVGSGRRVFEGTGIGSRQLRRLQSLALPMSATDVHQAFAEAIIAGRVGSTANHELITGVVTHTDRGLFERAYGTNARVSHFLQRRGDRKEGNNERSTRIDLKTQLSSITSVDEMSAVIKDSLIAKVRSILELGPDAYVDETTPLVQIGVDSLSAVDIRGWILSQLEFSVPILGILGGLTVGEITKQALEKTQAARLSGSAEKPE